MSSLGEDFPIEQVRVRELLGDYKALGPPGTFGAIVIEDLLKRADQAAISGDLPGMISTYREMKECN